MLRLYLQAPFGAFRTFTAGSFRPTAGFITPSAAYGLLLNAAGEEMRRDVPAQPATCIQDGLPACDVAIGALALPEQHTVYQQLHNYPVGNTGKESAPLTKGSKYNIAPVRRAFLSGIRAYVCVRGNEPLETAILGGLDGRSARTYGLPFLGDNSFLLDKLQAVKDCEDAYWYIPVHPETEDILHQHVTRLTIWIDRVGMSKTRSQLFAPLKSPRHEPPSDAWVEMGKA